MEPFEVTAEELQQHVEKDRDHLSRLNTREADEIPGS